MRMIAKKTIAIFSALLLIMTYAALVTGIPAAAEENVLPSGISYSEIDGRIKAFIQENEATTAGLAWSVFDTEGDLSAGYYGYADRENGIAVDEETVFEWGSGTKVLVWLSVMQQVEAGNIDLNTDISTYLPDGFLTNLKYDTPLTMIHLMTHTAGFQNVMADVNIDSPDYFSSLEEAVSANKPDQVYEPGSVTAYSNWGTSLAAYIVERVSGVEFSDYVHQHIFEPLGMGRSALFIDLSDNEWVRNKRSELQCYDADNRLIPNSFNYVSLYPSGRCVSTFGDFLTLGKAILNRDSRLMKAETWEELFTPTSYFDGTELPKNYHGFWAEYMSVPAVGHLGKTSGCSSYLLVDPKDGIGMLFVCNQGGESTYSDGLRKLVYGDFVYSDYGQQPELPAKNYRNSNTVTQGPFKFFGFYSALMSPINTEGQYWKVSPYTTGTRVEFAYMDYTETPVSVLLSEMLVMGSYILSLVFLLVTLVGRIPMSIIRAAKKQKRNELAVWSTVSGILPFLITGLYLIVIVSTGTTSDHYRWVFAVMCILAVCMTALAVYGVLKNRKADLPRSKKIYNYAVVLSLLISVVYIVYWNMFIFWKL